MPFPVDDAHHALVERLRMAQETFGLPQRFPHTEAMEIQGGPDAEKVAKNLSQCRESHVAQEISLFLRERIKGEGM